MHTDFSPVEKQAVMMRIIYNSYDSDDKNRCNEDNDN